MEEFSGKLGQTLGLLGIHQSLPLPGSFPFVVGSGVPFSPDVLAELPFRGAEIDPRAGWPASPRQPDIAKVPATSRLVPRAVVMIWRRVIGFRPFRINQPVLGLTRIGAFFPSHQKTGRKPDRALLTFPAWSLT